MVYIFKILFLIIIKLAKYTSQNNPDYSKFYVWGPGLDPNFNLPVRYFFIQAVDIYKNKYNLFLNKIKLYNLIS
jgi:hypothetical protein